MIPGSYYIKDNIYDVTAVEKGNYLGKDPDGKNIAKYAGQYRSVSPEQPYGFRWPVPAGDAREEYFKVLESAGASACRDGIDARIVREVETGTATFSGSVTGIPGIIDSEKDVSGK